MCCLYVQGQYLSLLDVFQAKRYLQLDKTMERKPSNLSATDSYYFQLSPSFFKVEHSFAKTMKSGCVYRLVLYKGIQKVDQMTEGVKGKLIGGRIVFEPTALSFNLPVFSPTRNIEFTVKVFETKPNEQEVQIAQHKIRSGDYIKTLRSDGTAVFREEAQLLESFVLVFDLFVQNSKPELEQLVKEYQGKSKVEERSRVNRMTTPNRAASDNLSQSDVSENSREGGVFNSKKKLSRKRGHDGKMKSKHGSRENSEVSSREGSVKSSKKAFGPFPHTEKNEHFVHSPKKASPPKVDNPSPTKSNPTKQQNLVSITRKDSNASEIAKPKLPLTPTKPLKIESSIDRSQSARKSPSYTQRSEVLPTETPVVSRRDALTKREEAAKPTSPSNIHNLEFKTNEKVFDIQRKNEAMSSSSKYPERARNAEALPPKNPSKVANTNALAQSQQAELTQIIQIPDADLSPQQQAQTSSKIKGEVSKQPSEPRVPSIKDSIQSKGSRAALPMMTLKDRQVLEQQERGVSELKMKQSMNWRSKAPSETENTVQESVKKEYESTRDKVFYVLFFIVSAFLFYNAVTPSRRV